GAAQFGRSIARFRSHLELRALGQEAQRQLGNLSDGLVLLSGNQLASQCVDPSSIGFREVDPRRLAERMLTRDALHDLEHLLSRAADAPREASSSFFAEVESTRLSLRAAMEHADA